MKSKPRKAMFHPVFDEKWSLLPDSLQIRLDVEIRKVMNNLCPTVTICDANGIKRAFGHFFVLVIANYAGCVMFLDFGIRDDDDLSPTDPGEPVPFFCVLEDAYSFSDDVVLVGIPEKTFSEGDKSDPFVEERKWLMSGKHSRLIAPSGATVQYSSDGIAPNLDNCASMGTITHARTVVGSVVTSTLSLGSAKLTETENGTTDTIATGGDSLIVEAGSVVISVNSKDGIYNFAVSSAVVETEQVAFDPTTGHATTDMTAAIGTCLMSIEQINPGEMLKDAGSTFTDDTSGGQVVNTYTVVSNGSRVNLAYDTTGGTRSTTVNRYSARALTETQDNNTKDNDVYDFYNTAASGDPLAARQFVNANGTDEVTTDGFAVNTVAGDTTEVMISASGGAAVTIADKSATDMVDLTSWGITADVDGINLTDALANVDTAGDVTLATSVSGAGISDLTLGSTGTDSFAVGSDQLSFAPSNLKLFADAGGTFDFIVASAAADYSSVVAWNSAIGQTSMDMTVTGGATFVTPLGQINPGDTQKDGGSTTTDYTSSRQAIDSDIVASNGSQVDTAAGTWSTAVRGDNGVGTLTETQYNNKHNNNVYYFYNMAAFGDPLTAQQLVNSNSSSEVVGDGHALSLLIGSIAVQACGRMATLKGFDLAQMDSAHAVPRVWITGRMSSGRTTIFGSDSGIDDVANCTATNNWRWSPLATSTFKGLVSEQMLYGKINWIAMTDTENSFRDIAESGAFNASHVASRLGASFTSSGITDRSKQEFDLHTDDAHVLVVLNRAGDWFVKSYIADKTISLNHGARRGTFASSNRACDFSAVCGTTANPIEPINGEMKDVSTLISIVGMRKLSMLHTNTKFSHGLLPASPVGWQN